MPTPSLPAIQQAELISRWQGVQQQIKAANPSQSVTLLAVSKTHSSDKIATLVAQGQQHFGENYLQEALPKIQSLSHLSVIWHYIGHIQRNKTRDIAQYFDWVQGVDRLIIADRLNEQRPADLPPLNVLIQVNIDDEISKSGCSPDELPELVAKISQFPNLRLRGVMVIPTPLTNKQGSENQESNPAFVQTKNLFDNCRQYHANPSDWDTLSMGMSGDMQAAIAAGSTMVRVGTAIFGERDYTQ